MSDTVNWSKVIEGLKQKDEQQQALFVDLVHKKLFEFCLYLCGHKQLAEDLCHDTLIKALLQISQLHDPNSTLSWVKRIARNLYLDHVKSASRSKTHISVEENPDYLENELKVSGASGEYVDALNMLQKLDEAERTILVLIDIQGYSYKETAEILQINEGTVKSRLHRARENFSQYFNGTKSA